MSNYIPLEQCTNGNLYKILARNGNYGVFNKETNGFMLAREKFGSVYLFEEYHYDTGAPFGTVRPLEDMGEIKLENGTLLKYLKGLEKELLLKRFDEYRIDDKDRDRLMEPWKD